jgi:predicted GH43/DUF377 family glycosyl hydrolase
LNKCFTLNWRVRLTALACLLIAGTYAVHAQPGFGQQWEKSGTPLFNIVGSPGSWNDIPSASPNVIGHAMFDGTEYKIYFGGHDGTSFATGLATSKDLESGWVAHPANPVFTVGPAGSWDEIAASNATVLFEDGMYKMWYIGADGNSVTRIGYATSPDGIAWTKYENNPVLDLSENGWDSGHLHTPYVIKDGGMYKMWYAGHGGSVTNWAIGYATSSDGISWTRNSGTPVLEAESMWESALMHTPTVIKDNGKFLMWYAGQDASADIGGVAQTGFAISDDGINWVKDPASPVLKIGDGSDFDSGVAIPLGVFKTDATTYKMLYGASNLTSFFGGLMATLVVPTTSVDAMNSAPAAFALEQNYPNPFNPETTIRYSLPRSGYVTLRVFNLLGEEVATLVDEKKSHGEYDIHWAPTGLPSGIYLYRLTAGEYVSVKTLLLQK